jgi:serine O-acetyltransferase
LHGSAWLWSFLSTCAEELIEQTSSGNNNYYNLTPIKEKKCVKVCRYPDWLRIRMIKSKEDYKFYLAADRLALAIRHKRPRIFQDETWRFERLLRKVEYLENCGNNPIDKMVCFQARFSLQQLSMKLHLTIGRNVFGPGLSIAHGGPIIVHSKAVVGENCRIDRCVSIGSIHYPADAPRIGNNVYIGPGAVIDGDIEIADGIAIGANSYVNKSFKEPAITIAGCPAKKISDKDSQYCWYRATEILRKEAEDAHIDKPK